MKPATLALLLLAAMALVGHCVAEDDHDHDHDHDHDSSHLESCPCAAEELGFSINCSDASIQTDAMAELQEHNCNATEHACEEAECSKAYYILQSHHDYCHHDDLADGVGVLLHSYESFCEDCFIARKYDSSLPACDAPDCDDDGAAAATDAINYLNDAANGCANDCSNDDCAANYKIIRAFHDVCGEDEIPNAVETGIHDFEDVCEAQGCNAHEEDADALVCTEEHGCFAGEATVQLESGRTVPMYELARGDRVLSVGADGALFYDRVFRVTQNDKDVRAVRSVEIELVLPSGRTLTVAATPDHLLPVNQGAVNTAALTPASAVVAGDSMLAVDGDAVVEARVAGAKTTRSRNGLVNVHTLSGVIVVNGAVASHFTAESTFGAANTVVAPLWYRLADALGGWHTE